MVIVGFGDIGACCGKIAKVFGTKVIGLKRRPEIVSEEELGGANLHCEESGVSDHLAQSETHAFQICRSIVANLGFKNNLKENQHNRIRPDRPLFD